MILTVTPNPALDMTWRLDALTPGATHRAPTGTSRAGGKGVNVARVLHAQGQEVLTLSTVGGTTGAEFENELRASGISHRLIRVHAATRRSVAIVDGSRGETTVLNERGSDLAPGQVADLEILGGAQGGQERACEDAVVLHEHRGRQVLRIGVDGIAEQHELNEGDDDHGREGEAVAAKLDQLFDESGDEALPRGVGARRAAGGISARFCHPRRAGGDGRGSSSTPRERWISGGFAAAGRG